MLAKRAIGAVLLAFGAALSLSACIAVARTEPAYAEVDDVPADIEVYPHTIYEGRTVYWLDDRWYYREGPHWVYYRSEPADLVRYRARVQQAPSAPRREYHERAAPEAPRREYYERGAKREYSAPPAHEHDRRHAHEAPEERRREPSEAPPAAHDRR